MEAPAGLEHAETRVARTAVVPGILGSEGRRWTCWSDRTAVLKEARGRLGPKTPLTGTTLVGDDLSGESDGTENAMANEVENDLSGVDLDVSVGGHRSGLVEQSVASSLPKKKAMEDDDDELLEVAMNTASQEAEVQLACLAVVIPGGGTVDEVDLKALMVGSCASPVFK